MYINKQTGNYPVTEQQIRMAHPNTSFGVPFYPPEDYAVVFPVPRPDYNPITHVVKEVQPVLTDKGHYEQVFVVEELPEDVVTANQSAAFIQKMKAFDSALTNLLDTTAQSRRYDNRISCMVRAGFPGPFQAEAITFAPWADECNALAYQILAEVQAGTRPEPANVEEFLALLPVIDW
jgi:hypothetical protein